MHSVRRVMQQTPLAPAPRIPRVVLATLVVASVAAIVAHTASAQPAAMPNLKLLELPGWPDAGFVLTQEKDNCSLEFISVRLHEGDTWLCAGFANEGPDSVEERFTFRVLFDGAAVVERSFPGISTGVSVQVSIYLGYIPAGIHIVTVVVDPEDAVVESIESDNTVERRVLWVEPRPIPGVKSWGLLVMTGLALLVTGWRLRPAGTHGPS